ncbi:putative ATP-binding cassette [Operophtera brumata]|uniref:Putative ATP-binding cassette n=1 Tax=Operophtera brumata TaxID=104452 RepID=A0A0L7LSE3_OPEBR|nr:putative ATP-binding cassette [Operophtera brumata]
MTVQATDNARWVLHKVFMLSPQFALGDCLLEIAKNTIQAQVLYRFGMDTYKNPLSSNLIAIHVCYLLAVGTAFLLLNLAIEYGYFDALVTR